MTYIIEPANDRLEAMGSDYRIEWTEAFGGSLYDFNETLEAVEEGPDRHGLGRRALGRGEDAASEHHVLDALRDQRSRCWPSQVLNEMNDTLPDMQEEWSSHNLVFLGASVNDTYHLLTTFPVNSLADLNGRKIVGAPALGPWLGGTGAVPVAGGLPTMYQSIQTGRGRGHDHHPDRRLSAAPA